MTTTTTTTEAAVAKRRQNLLAALVVLAIFVLRNSYESALLVTNTADFQRNNVVDIDGPSIRRLDNRDCREEEEKKKEEEEKKKNDDGGDDRHRGDATATAAVVVDGRLLVDRPYMETVSGSFLDSIRETQRARKTAIDPGCDKWGGTAYVEGLIGSARQLLDVFDSSSSISNSSSTSSSTSSSSSSPSSLLLYENVVTSIYFAENVSLVVGAPPKRPLRLEVNRPFVNFDGEENRRKKKQKRHGSTILRDLSMAAVVPDRGGEEEEDPCAGRYLDYPVMIVDDDLDTWNWWWFLRSILNHYVIATVVQPKMVGGYGWESVRTAFLIGNVRSFGDAFDFVFGGNRPGGGRRSRQLWNLEGGLPIVSDGDSTNERGGEGGEKRYCFRKLIWSPGSIQGSDTLLMNKKFHSTNCFSSIVYSYSAQLKAALRIPTLPKPEKPRVVWVGRDMSPKQKLSAWQRKRLITNQEEVVEHLRSKCEELGIEMVVADFYGDKSDVAFEEQVRFVSRCHVMIGIHGAGLNLFHFLPFGSNIVEIHKGTSMQHNSKNYVNHIGTGRYFEMEAGASTGDRKTLDKDRVWDTLKKAIDAWKAGK